MKFKPSNVPFHVSLCGDAELRKVWHHFDPLFPLNSSPLLSFFSFIQSPSTPLFLGLFSPAKHHYHGRKVHHPVRWVRVHVRTQRRAVSSQFSSSKPSSGRGGNAHCHDAPCDHAGVWEEDGIEGRRGGGGRPPGSAELGRRPLGLPFGTMHRQEVHCPEGQRRALRNYTKANDGRTSPKGCRHSPLRRPDASDAHGGRDATRLHREEQKRRCS